MNIASLPKLKSISMYSSISNIVIIDDDSCHNIVCALSLKKIFKPANINIVGFTNVHEGIEYLKNQVANKTSKTVLFLDINMPQVSGWEVLAKIEAMPDSIKNNLIVYMLSSSVTASDRAKSFSFSYVKDCLEKPLSDHFLSISEELNEIALMQKIYA